MTSTIQMLKDRSRKEVVSPFTEASYTIKRLSQMEYTRIQLTPILGIVQEEEPTEKETLQYLLQRGIKTIEIMRWTLENGVVQPKLFFGDEAAAPPDTAHADWLGPDQPWLFTEILKFSGLDDESQATLSDFLKNGHGSARSTVSPDGTERSQAS